MQTRQRNGFLYPIRRTRFMLEPRRENDTPAIPAYTRYDEASPMSKLRALLVVGGLLVLTSGSLSAQAMKVTCKDGSKSAGGQGACSGHGGIAAAVAAKADAKAAKSSVKADAKAAKSEMKADAKAAKTEMKSDTKAAKSEMKSEAKATKASAKSEDLDAKGATAMCKDKTYSHAKNAQGQCSGHGGVAKKL